jgi:hypothetical protein
MADGKSMESRADGFFEKIGKYLVDKISRFVTFLYLLVGLGAIYGRFVIPRFPGLELYLLGLPFVIALLAYYNRVIAIISFVVLILFFFIL